MDERERAWRSEFPITDRFNYLNNCSLTPLHRRGRKAIERFASEWAEQGGRAWYDHWIGEYEALREDLAGVLGASVNEIAIEPNVSAGLVGIASTFDYCLATGGSVMPSGWIHRRKTPITEERVDHETIAKIGKVGDIT